MEIIYWILLATFIDSLIGLVGILTLWINQKSMNKIIFWLVAFSAGTLLGGAFFHLIAEAVEQIEPLYAMVFTMIGFVIFYIMERFLFWHHCHEGHCDVHPFSYLLLVGDGMHNIIDGFVIAASFLVDIKFGIITTAMIISHEVPQELGNYAVLLYGGFDKWKASLYNFLAQITCVLGGLLGYYMGTAYDITAYLLPIAAGGFIYISASDLIPELHKEKQIKKSLISLIVFLVGVVLMFGMKLLFE
jgi:zinc and cadmium transporter